MGFLSSLFGRKKGPHQPDYSSVEGVRAATIATLRDMYPGAEAEASSDHPAKFHTNVGDSSLTLDVTNLFGQIRSYSDLDPQAEITRFVRALADYGNRSANENNLIAVVRTLDYFKTMPQILHEPLAGDLAVVYMVDMPDSMSPITQEDMPGASLEHIRETAFSNVNQWLPEVGWDDQLGDIILFGVNENTMLSPTLILLDGFWEFIKDRFPGDVVIALPRKDQLFIAQDDEDGRAAARRLIGITFAEGFSLLSERLYARRGGKIVALDN